MFPAVDGNFAPLAQCLESEVSCPNLMGFQFDKPLFL